MRSTGLKFLILFSAFFLIYSKSFSHKRQTHILILGDSLSAGYGVAQKDSYPQVLKNNLQKSGYPIQITNGSQSGLLSSALPARAKFYLEKLNPDFLIIFIGGNDARKVTPVKDISQNIEKVIQLAKEKNVKVALVKMDIFRNLGPKYVKEFQNLYSHLIKKHNLLGIPFPLEEIAGKSEFNQADGFHPNEKGHAIMAKIFTKEVSKWLKPVSKSNP